MQASYAIHGRWLVVDTFYEWKLWMRRLAQQRAGAGVRPGSDRRKTCGSSTHGLWRLSTCKPTTGRGCQSWSARRSSRRGASPVSKRASSRTQHTPAWGSAGSLPPETLIHSMSAPAPPPPRFRDALALRERATDRQVIGEYVGRVIPVEQAPQRGAYSAALFARAVASPVLDASSAGNETRFVNDFRGDRRDLASRRLRSAPCLLLRPARSRLGASRCSSKGQLPLQRGAHRRPPCATCHRHRCHPRRV